MKEMKRQMVKGAVRIRIVRSTEVQTGMLADPFIGKTLFFHRMLIMSYSLMCLSFIFVQQDIRIILCLNINFKN